jgi:hypothetical protein
VTHCQHEVSLTISRPIPVGNVDIEIPVRRNGRAFGKVKTSKGSIDSIRIEFVDRPLYDYVQHGSSSLGHATANRMPTLSGRIRALPARSPRERVRKWRMHYFVDIVRLMQFAAVLQRGAHNT